MKRFEVRGGPVHKMHRVPALESEAISITLDGINHIASPGELSQLYDVGCGKDNMYG